MYAGYDPENMELVVMEKKIRIEKNTVSETLVIPLYGRAHCSKKYPDVFFEPEAEKIIDMVEYDFSALNYKEFMLLTWAVRKRMLCDKAREYLQKHPKATIVNLGCGADVSFASIDNGYCHFINLDLPEVIEAREKLVACREREKNVAMDAFDTTWFDEIETPVEDGVYVISGGVFMYFDAKKIKKLFVEMAKRFPGGGVCFDACNSMGLKKSNRVVEKSGNTGAPIMLAVDDAQKLFLPWSERFEKINVVTKLPQDMKEAKSVSWMSKFILNMGMKMKMIQIVEILFY